MFSFVKIYWTVHLKFIYGNVYSGFILNHPKLEAIQMYLNEAMDKQTVTHAYTQEYYSAIIIIKKRIKRKLHINSRSQSLLIPVHQDPTLTIHSAQSYFTNMLPCSLRSATLLDPKHNKFMVTSELLGMAELCAWNTSSPGLCIIQILV